MTNAPPTPKGFRDIQSELAKKRRIAVNTIADVLEKNGFVPIETPTIEFADTLKGKYGEEERLIYEFTDRGDRKLALRYDLTVPLARFVAGNLNLIAKDPFRRYQIGQVFRGENPQAGRWREFTQFDFDTVGLTKEPDSAIKEDALIIATAIQVARKLELKNTIMAVNDRRNFSGIPIDVIRAFDKLKKIGIEAVEKEILAKNYSKADFEKYKLLITTGRKSILDPLISALGKEYGLKENQDFYFAPSLARGLDYYTSTIFELVSSSSYGYLSIGGGGRYDNLIGMFSKQQIPAVGFSFGIDRLIELTS